MPRVVRRELTRGSAPRALQPVGFPVFRCLASRVTVAQAACGPASCSEMALLGVRGKPCAVLLPRAGAGAAGQNRQHSITKNTAKLDRETEELHHDRVTLEVGKVIQQGRQSKGLTQKDLATVSTAGPFLPGCGWAGGRSVVRTHRHTAGGGF